METLHRFEGKVVVMTGASRGIGRGIAERFAREGASVLMSANEEKIYEAAEELNEKLRADSGGGKPGKAQSGSAESGGGRSSAHGPGDVVPVFCDVTDDQSVDGLYKTALSKFGKVDIAFHNAGVITIARIGEMTEEEWDTVLDVNAKGVFLCCRAAAKIMIKQKSGCIINTASGQSRQGFIYTPHYAASKMGVMGITQSLAQELAPLRIRVNAIAPGIIKTDMWVYNDCEWGKLLGYEKEGDLMKDWTKKIPMGYAGAPDDIAGVVTFLASEDAGYVTGQTINVDGGMFMS